jgi:hypothetical protein
MLMRGIMMMGRLEMKDGMGEKSLFEICVDSVGVGGCEDLYYTVFACS